MSSPVSYDLQGQGGGTAIDSGSSPGTFRWIQVITDTVFADLTSSNIANTANLVGPTIPAGTGIGGRFTNVDVTSGLVIAYYA